MQARSYIRVIILASILASCGGTEATYFRKADATQGDERRSWGLCGGDFLPNGQLDPSIDQQVVQCMRRQGYLTQNEYYVERHVDFVYVANPTDRSRLHEDLVQCGMIEPESIVCEIFPYIYESQVPALSSCMNRKGYSAALPRYKQGVRIYPDGTSVTGALCNSLTPRNSRGGVSLGSYRTN